MKKNQNYFTEEIPSYEIVKQDILNIVFKYEDSEYKSIDDFMSAYRSLVTLNYYLTCYNIEAQKEHNSYVVNSESVTTTAKTEADEAYPMYKDTHKRLQAVNNLMWALKNEFEYLMHKERVINKG